MENKKKCNKLAVIIFLFEISTKDFVTTAMVVLKLIKIYQMQFNHLRFLMVYAESEFRKLI